MDNDPIGEAYRAASTGRFTVQACYCGTDVPENESRAYEERAWDLVRKSTMDSITDAHNFVLMAGLPADEMTAEEILRYIANDADSDYDNLKIEKVIIWK